VVDDRQPIGDDPGAASPTFRRPPGRYGQPRRHPRLTALVLSGLLTAFALAVAVLGWQLSNPEITVTYRGSEVIDEQAVDVSYLIRRADGSAEARCILRALDRAGNEVGRTTVDVPPGAADVVRTDRITTSSRAFVGQVQECTIV
jgi:hypothetical protein